MNGEDEAFVAVISARMKVVMHDLISEHEGYEDGRFAKLLDNFESSIRAHSEQNGNDHSAIAKALEGLLKRVEDTEKNMHLNGHAVERITAAVEKMSEDQGRIIEALSRIATAVPRDLR